MRKLRVFIGLALAGISAQPALAQNFLVNSNFATGDFTGWTVAEGSGGGSPTDYGVTSTTDGGMKVPNPNTGDKFGAFINPSGVTLDLSQTVTLPEAGQYTITCAIEPVFNDVDTLTISLAGGEIYTTNYEVGQPYTEISVTVNANAGAQILDFQLVPGSGPIFFDDAGIVEVGSTTPPPPPPPPPPGEPTPSSVLGTAGAGAVVGLDGTAIINFRSEVDGDEYVSQGGVLDNLRPGLISGNVFAAAKHEYFGIGGKLTGAVNVDATLLTQVNSDASNAVFTISQLTPTQTFGSIRRATTITGNGGVNVIEIKGDILSSLTLDGTSNDVFFVTVLGSIDLRERTTLGVSGGATASSVLYNLIGQRGGFVEIENRDVVNGSILAPGYNIGIEGTVNGSVIGGGRRKTIELFDAKVE